MNNIEKGVDALFKTYKGIGHEQPATVKEEILGFFQRHIQQLMEADYSKYRKCGVETT